MKTIKNTIIMLLAVIGLTACVEDKVYEGPNAIETININPEAPTSFDDVVVTATTSGLLAVTKASLTYTIAGTPVTVEMTGTGKAFSATIPAQPDGTKVVYVVTIENEAGYTTVSGEKDYTVGDKPADYSKLVLNELYGAAADDAAKFIELYNNGDDPIKLKGVVIKKDEAEAWVGIDGEVIMPHSHFAIVGAKGTTPRGFSSGFSNKKSVLVELYDPNGNLRDTFQRGEKGSGWGDQSLAKVDGSWSRCPDGTGRFLITTPTLGTANPATGTEDPTVVQ